MSSLLAGIPIDMEVATAGAVDLNPLPNMTNSPANVNRVQPSGRLSVPYVLLYYLPENCNPNQRMSYAGAVEVMRNQAEVSKVIEIQSAEDVESIEKKLSGEE